MGHGGMPASGRGVSMILSVCSLSGLLTMTLEYVLTG